MAAPKKDAPESMVEVPVTLVREMVPGLQARVRKAQHKVELCEKNLAAWEAELRKASSLLELASGQVSLEI